MSGALLALLIVALVATLGVLLLGIFSMARGGDFNRRHGNRIMRLRVVLQGAALALLAAILLLGGRE